MFRFISYNQKCVSRFVLTVFKNFNVALVCGSRSLPFPSALKRIDFFILTDQQNQADLIGYAEDDLIFAG